MPTHEYSKRSDINIYNFTTEEWRGIIGAGDVAASISFAANSGVLLLHAFLTWYRPAIVNRLSLRMIVLSCIFNMVYCACQLVTDSIASWSITCRVLAYVLIISDTMACMCLAMVGLNLVMIFVLKFSRSIKLEALYYLIIAVSGVFVFIVPYTWGTRKGPNAQDANSSCWYHYYFDGRINNIFNWMWYYSWLLLSLVFAALCAVISIRFVMKKQENFAGNIDMYTRRGKNEVNNLNILRKYSNNNTDVFQKIARRCVCYPLIPLLSKSWGVALEIAASRNAWIPYPIFVLDRVFSCLLGFMVSCIYFTDPAIGAVFKESKEAIKKKYVYDYYIVKYQPVSDPNVPTRSQYPQIIKVLPLEESHSHPAYSSQIRSLIVEREGDSGDHQAATTTSDAIISSQDGSSSDGRYINPLDTTYILPIYRPGVPTMEVHKKVSRGSVSSTASDTRRYSILNVTSKDGSLFAPNKILVNNNQANHTKCLFVFKKSAVSNIPMRRVINTSDTRETMIVNCFNRIHQHSRSNITETIEYLIPYKSPKVAKFLHWTLVSVFKVTPMKPTDSSNAHVLTDQSRNQYASAPSGTFNDYTDGTPHQTLDLSTSNRAGSSTQKDPITAFKKPGVLKILTPTRSHAEGSGSHTNIQQDDDKSKENPLRRVSTTNIASSTGAPPIRPTASLERRSSSISTRSKLARTLGLSNVLNHGGIANSFSWGRSSHASSSAAAAKKSSPSTSAPVQPMPTSYSDTTEIMDMISSSKTVKFGGPIYKDAYKDNDDSTEQQSQEPEGVISGLDALTTSFPVELSPRPISQYRKPRVRRPTVSNYPLPGEASSSAPIPTDAVPIDSSTQTESDMIKRMTVFAGVNDDDDDDAILALEELLELEHFSEQEESASSIAAEEAQSVSFSPTDEAVALVSNLAIREVSQYEVVLARHEGFAGGHTTIEIIANGWDALGIEEEASRFVVHSEPWNIEEQIQKQVEMAEDMERI